MRGHDFSGAIRRLEKDIAAAEEEEERESLRSRESFTGQTSSHSADRTTDKDVREMFATLDGGD